MRHWGALLFAIVIAATAPLGMAHADCVDDCERTYGGCGGPEQNECLERLQQCYRLQCNKPTVSYGAIAYGAKSTAYGYSFDERSSRDADRKALANCQPNGNDCKVVTSISNSCAAVAAIESKGVFSTGSGGTEESAESSALKSCERDHGKGCEIEVWTCAKP
jgi:uncharacterized protein DUF4189